MLADDSVTAQNMGRKILADAGYEVITVNNGSAALKRIPEVKPDVIVLDVYMPGYSGLEVCQRLKESSDTARIPILLTVGKLEPFKPEEARRVRAEGFIVKPFEASELLSALTKLEDKIVPRADSSKPGRFARAIAAVEEGRYDKAVPIDEDSGWKNRISFPKKKKEKPSEPEDGDDPAIYNAVNRDLKTTIEHKPVHDAQPTPVPVHSPAEESAHVDLGALVAHGLPKDVTAEEIAALAAAAAQVQGITEGSKTEAPMAAPTSAPQVEQADSQIAEIKTAETQPSPAEATVPADPLKTESIPADLPAPQVGQAEATSLAGPEVQGDEAKESDTKQVVTETAASVNEALNELPVTFAQEKPEQEAAPEAESKAAEVAKHESAESSVESLPTIASFAAPDPSDFGNGTSPYTISKAAEPEPVTIAVAAAAGAVAPSRWAAVAVALAPEETSLSLEEEMRRAQESAPVAHSPEPAPVEAQVIEQLAEVGETALAAEIPVNPPTVEVATPVVPISLPSTAPEFASPEPASMEPAPETTDSSAVSANPAVKEFETVALPEPESASAVAEAGSELPSLASTVSREVTEESAGVSTVAEGMPEVKQPESAAVEAPYPITNSIPGSTELAKPAEPERAPVGQETVPEVVDHALTPENSEGKPATEAATPTEISAPQAPETHISQENVEPAAIAATERISGGLPDMAKKESEMAATTAAAWASWRRIRETGDGKSTGSEQEPAGAEPSREEAAMAVAAGAEKAPEDASPNAEVSPEIANIVDTVLADLRPKIVEEISKKLGKKK